MIVFPKRWQVKKLGDIAITSSGGTPARKHKEYWGGEIKWLKISDLNDGYIQEAEETITDDGLRNSSAKILPRGTLLLAMYGSIGKLGILDICAATNQAICAISQKAVKKFLKKYLFYYFMRIKGKMLHEAFGGMQKNISQTYIKNLEIPLPPLSEQNLIIKKIEYCFERIDRVISRLKSSKELLEIYKQSVLSHAFSGKLTNSDFNSWEIKKLCEVSEVITGSTPPKNESKFYGNEYPFFKPTDLNLGYFVDFSRENLSKNGWKISRQLPPKSILVTCIGATIGKTGFIRVHGSCNQQINAIIPRDVLIPEYVYFYVISNKFQNLIIFNSSSTTLPILNKNKFENLEILFPKIHEQAQIVTEIEKRFQIADKALESINQSLEKAENLKQSILKKAFSGELVKDENE